MQEVSLSCNKSIISQEQEAIKELKANITENFVILEDLYSQVFNDLGVTYRFYADVHPDHSYSKIRWVEEQEVRIRTLKQKKINDLRRNYAFLD